MQTCSSWNEDTKSDSQSKVNNKHHFDHNKHAEPFILSTIHTKISYAEIRLKVPLTGPIQCLCIYLLELYPLYLPLITALRSKF